MTYMRQWIPSIRVSICSNDQRNEDESVAVAVAVAVEEWDPGW